MYHTALAREIWSELGGGSRGSGEPYDILEEECYAVYADSTERNYFRRKHATASTETALVLLESNRFVLEKRRTKTHARELWYSLL